MKNLKLSFALIIAVLAVGVTVAANANVFGKRAVTRCFTQLSLQNASATQFNVLNVASPLISCSQAQSRAIATPYLKDADLPSSLESEEACDLIEEVFCCATVVEITAADPGYANAPFVNLNDGLNKKYKIQQVFCKTTPQP